MLPTWEQRSIITANLLNPAFCGEIIRLATSSYEKKAGKPLAFPLSFLILPLVLHKKTRDTLPKTIATKLHDWLSSNDELKIGMAERIKYLVPYTRETILFLLFHEVLSLDNAGQLTVTSTSKVQYPDSLTEEIHEILKKSQSIGRWMAVFPRESMVYTMFGIQP